MASTLIGVCITFLLIHSGAVLQNDIRDTKGNSFTLGFFPEYAASPTAALTNLLYLSSPLDGTCTVSYHDGTRRNTQVTLVAHQVVEKALPDTTQMTNVGTGVQPKAIYVDCTVEIALYGFNAYSIRGYTSDSFTVFPNNMLATKYLVASVNDTAFIGVVAVESDTQLTINIKSNSKCQNKHKYYRSGDIINVTLAHGDVFRIGNSKMNDSCDFGGTEIQSSHPVAVFSGALHYVLRHFTHIVHQVPPETAFSRTIIIPGFKEPQAESPTVRVVASQDNTVLKVTTESTPGGVTTNTQRLDNREVLNVQFKPGAFVVIQSNFPVMAVQRIFFQDHGGSLVFIPGVGQYEKNFLIKAIDVISPDRGLYENPQIAIVSESSSIRDVRVNGVYPQGVTWSNLTTLPYSIGSLGIQRHVSYTITSSSPVLVRFHEVVERESYVAIAGFQLENADNRRAAQLKCLPGRWIVNVDLRMLNPRPSDPVSDIYMFKDKSTCRGTVEGDNLVFNKTYDDCNTKLTVSDGKLHYTNSILYTRHSANRLVTHVISILDIDCVMPVNSTDSVHIYPDFNTTEHTKISGVVDGSTVDVSLYTDAAYQHPVTDSVVNVKIEQPVYVQVTSSGSQDTVMMVRSCDAHLEEDKDVSHPLIENGCSTDGRTQILVTRNQVTRFKFVMFDLPNERDGIYVTCHVTFCDSMDFSARCQQHCTTDHHIGIVG